MATLATRVISGRGLLRIPASADLRKCKRLSLYVDVIRLPFNQYRNENYNPPKSRYGTINLFKTDFWEKEICIEYPRQAFHFYPDPAAQTFYLLKCVYAELTEGLELGFAGAGSPVGFPDTFADWWHTDYWWDEAKVVCYADAALKLVVESEEFILCADDEDPQPPPPPPPPPEPTDVPPGTSLGEENTPISNPYQEPDDNGDTVPYPGDSFPTPEPEFPQGARCAKYLVHIECRSLDANSLLVSDLQLFGEIENIYIGNEGRTVYVTCYGEWLYSYSPCPNVLQDRQAMGASGGINPETLTYTITPL